MTEFIQYTLNLVSFHVFFRFFSISSNYFTSILNAALTNTLLQNVSKSFSFALLFANLSKVSFKLNICIIFPIFYFIRQSLYCSVILYCFTELPSRFCVALPMSQINLYIFLESFSSQQPSTFFEFHPANLSTSLTVAFNGYWLSICSPRSIKRS